MDISVQDGNGLGVETKASRAPDPRTMDVAWETMRRGTAADVATLPVAVLKQLAHEALLQTGGKKNKLLSELNNYVRLIC